MQGRPRIKPYMATGWTSPGIPDDYFDVTQIATVFIGDMLGGAIVLTVISVTTVLISRLRRARTYT